MFKRGTYCSFVLSLGKMNKIYTLLAHRKFLDMGWTPSLRGAPSGRGGNNWKPWGCGVCDDSGAGGAGAGCSGGVIVVVVGVGGWCWCWCWWLRG